MRKILLLAAATFVLSIAAKAQIVSSTSSMTTTTRVETESNTRSYVRVGMSLNNIVEKDCDDGTKYKDFDSNVGYNLLFGFQKPLGKLGAYYGMEYGLSTRGFKDTDDDDTYSFTCHQIQFSPFNFGWNITCVQDIFQVDPHVGICITFDYIAIEKNGLYMDEYGQDDMDECNNSEFEYWYGKSKSEYYEKHNMYESGSWMESYLPFDAKLSFGCGFWFINKINVDFTFQRGFLDMNCWYYEDWKIISNSCMIRVGYAF